MTGIRPEDLPHYLFTPLTLDLVHDGSRASADRIRDALVGSEGIELINITDPARHPQGLVHIAYHRSGDTGARRRPRYISPEDHIIVQDARARVSRAQTHEDVDQAQELITTALERAESYPPGEIPADMALALQLANVLDQVLRT